MFGGGGEGGAVPASCPRCSAPLLGARWRRQEVLECRGCDTGWWDRVALGRAATLVSDSLEARLASAEIEAAVGSPAPGRCPACADTRMETADWGSIPIHRCGACGTTGLTQQALVGRVRVQRRDAARKVARSTARGMIISLLGPILDFLPLALDRVLFRPD